MFPRCAMILQADSHDVSLVKNIYSLEYSIPTSNAQTQRRRGGWNFLFPLSTYYKVLYTSLRLCSEVHSTVVVVCCCVSFNNRHRTACLLPSLTTVNYYFVLILHVTATTDLSDDGRLVVKEFTLTTSSSPKRRIWASLY